MREKPIQLSCLHPKTVYNKVLGRYISVPCRQCLACRSKRRHKWVARLNSETASHKYQRFVTLTYDEDNLPRFFVEKVNDSDSTEFRVSLFSPDYRRREEYVISDNDTQVYLSQFWKRESQDDTISFEERLKKYSFSCGNVVDVQKFHKRLRSRLTAAYKKEFPNSDNDEIRKNTHFTYFFINELGPTTLRAHYHGIYWFDSDWLSSHFDSALSASWKLGRSDCQRVRSSVSSYVAGYLNNFTALPSFYRQCKYVRPFMLCSKSIPLGFSKVFNDSAQKDAIFLEHATTITIDIPQAPYKLDVGVPAFIARKLFPRLPYASKLSPDYEYYYSLIARRFPDCGKWLEHARPYIDESSDEYGTTNFGIFMKSIQATENTLKSFWLFSKSVCWLSDHFGWTELQVLSHIHQYYEKRAAAARSNYYSEYNVALSNDEIDDDDFYIFFPPSFKLNSNFVPYVKPIEQCAAYQRQESALQKVEDEFHAKRCKNEYLELHPELVYKNFKHD